MLLNLIENYLTFKPNPEYDPSVIPKDCVVRELESQNFRLQLAYKITESPVLTINCHGNACLLYTSPSPRDKRQSRMPSSA